MKLYLQDSGDPSVGMFPIDWDLDVPFHVEDESNPTEEEQEQLEEFRYSIMKAYTEYCEGRLRCFYRFEIERENKAMDEAFRDPIAWQKEVREDRNLDL